MDSRAKEVISIGDGLFTKKQPIVSLWQAIAEQFDPTRADYTLTRSAGMEFASHLMTGIPTMASRDLANAISAMLRPPGQVWFHPRTNIEAINKDFDRPALARFCRQRHASGDVRLSLRVDPRLERRRPRFCHDRQLLHPHPPEHRNERVWSTAPSICATWPGPKTTRAWSTRST